MPASKADMPSPSAPLTPLLPAAEPSIAGIVTEIVYRRRVIMALAVAGLIIGTATGLLSKRQYTAAAVFIPQGSDASSMNGLALAASQFGIRVPSQGGGWGPSVYVQLLQSHSVMSTIAAETLTVAEMGNQRRTVRELMGIDDAGPQGIEMTIRELRRRIGAAEVKRISGVELSARTPWPSVSFGLTTALLDEINRFNLNVRQSQARSERQFAETQAAAAQKALSEAEDSLRQFQRANRVVGAEASFERDRLTQSVSFRREAYNALRQSLTEAQLREVRDTPVISVIEAPTVPVIGDSRQTALRGLVGGLLGFTLGILWASLAAIRRSSDPATQALFAALDSAVPARMRLK